MRSQLGTRLLHCCRRLQDFCFTFEKGRITSFGEQDEIGLNRFPCLTKLWIFPVSSAASVGSEHISNETLHSYLCGAGPAPETPSSLQLLAYSATADSLGIAHRAPSQRKRFGGFVRVGICSDLLQT